MPGAQSAGALLIDAPPLILTVGDMVGPGPAEDLGLEEGRFSERALAFVLLVLLDQHGQLDPPTERERVPQRRRFAEHLGMTSSAFRKFVERTFRPRSGRILRWDRRPKSPGPEPSWTGGPWWMTVREARIEPNIAEARAFLDRVRSRSTDRREGPPGLLRAALTERGAGNWVEAMAILESGAAMFRRRRWPRSDPLWFDILILLAGTEMQLGRKGLWPRLPVNIRISVTEQGLRGPDADLIRGRAHFVAALMYNQSENRASAQNALAEVRRCQELLRGRQDEPAVIEYWKARSYEETTLAKLSGTAAPATSSAILEASRVFTDGREQEWMRYGEALLYAGQPAKGLTLIEKAAASGGLSLPAAIIAARLKIVGRWILAGRPGPALEALAELERRARSHGFSHQVRTIRRLRSLIQRGVRSLRR